MADLPAMQNQFVEFAKRDSEGRDIAKSLDVLEETASVYTYAELTLTTAQWTELTTQDSVQIDLSEDPDELARIMNANVLIVFSNPAHTGKTIVAQRQTVTTDKSTFESFEPDNSDFKHYSIDANAEGAVNIGLSALGGNVIGFDGEVEVTTNNNQSYIASANLPTKNGIYKLTHSNVGVGFMIFGFIGGTSNTFFACYGMINGIGNPDTLTFRVGSTSINNDLVFKNYQEIVMPQLYVHSISTNIFPNFSARFLSFYRTPLNFHYEYSSFASRGFVYLSTDDYNRLFNLHGYYGSYNILNFMPYDGTYALNNFGQTHRCVRFVIDKSVLGSSKCAFNFYNVELSDGSSSEIIINKTEAEFGTVTDTVTPF